MSDTSEITTYSRVSNNGTERQDRVRIETGDEPDGGRSNRVWKILAVIIVGSLVALAAFFFDPRNLLDEDPVPAGTGRDTATVGLSTLADDYSADGDLVYADALMVSWAGQSSVVTWVIEPGTIVERGDVLWRVEDSPTVALSRFAFGGIPSYRSLGRGDEGIDVAQLEMNLVALGYDPDATVTVDETFTSATEAMVERWQGAIGAEATGTVDLGSVVYVTGTSLTGTVEVSVGDTLASGAIALALTSLDREIVFSVPASDRTTLALGDNVEVRLPDRTTFDAEVTGQTIQDDGGATFSAAPLVNDLAYRVDTVPVTVNWTVPIAFDALTVPAEALARADSGQYYVEVVNRDGSTEFVAVEIGRASGSTVEIVGNVSEGDTVISP
jgi:peptidoglycan hydrolase-like protein with peptidoglycan-binding domain